MPFTLSHTVAVIPLYKYFGKYSAFSALIIGSMVPDFAYLTPFLVDQRVDSHSLLGIYLYGIPMGLTVFFLYHWLMAPVIVSLFPKSVQKYLNPDLFKGKIPKVPAFVLLLALVVGALTHIFWDFFTHQSGIPQWIDWFNQPLTRIDGYGIMPYRVLQHFSSIAGLGLLLFLSWQWWRKQQKSGKSSQELTPWEAPVGLKKVARYTLLILPAVAGIISGIIHFPETQILFGLYSTQIFIRYFILGAAGSFIMSCALLGILYQIALYQLSNKKTI